MPRNATIVRTLRAQPPVTGTIHEMRPEEFTQRYNTVRQATLAISAGLSPEDCALQSMPDASPIKWHLAHTSWFFETFVLERAVSEYRHFHPQYRVLFNSYYVG